MQVEPIDAHRSLDAVYPYEFALLEEVLLLAKMLLVRRLDEGVVNPPIMVHLQC